MHQSFRLLIIASLFAKLLLACVDPIDQTLVQRVDVIVVDGTITNLAEPQIIRLNQARADAVSGKFVQTPLVGARVTVVVHGLDSSVVTARETSPGVYQLADGFQGKAGNQYRLRFQLTDGTAYESSAETMPAVPPIDRITDRYNSSGASYGQPDGLLAANDLYVQTTDPADQRNFYRWDWVLWERQNWCQTCVNGYYYQYDDAGIQIDRCVPLPPRYPQGTDYYEYACRTQCWEVFFSSQLLLFADTYTNGRVIADKRVAQIPFYQYNPALVELRQSALTQPAFAYFNQLAEQTQRTGGLTDAPPVAPIGNVHNVANGREAVVGYFAASGVSAVRYWLTRRDVEGGLPFAPGTELSNVFFRILNQRDPHGDGLGGRNRPPLAVCVPSDHRTPVKPIGWRD